MATPIHATCINDAWRQVLRHIADNGIHQNSRSGYVRMAPAVALTIQKEINGGDPGGPTLLDIPDRKANPVLWLYEWILNMSGIHALTPRLREICPRMADYTIPAPQGDRYTMEGELFMGLPTDVPRVFPGSYGRAWAYREQLYRVVKHLRNNQQTRRAVVAHFFPGVYDLDTCPDIPCNTHLLFEVSENRVNLTVFNRSNDVVWGMLGANYFVFSQLLLLVSAAVGLGYGEYRVVSANPHIYERHFHFLLDPGKDGVPPAKRDTEWEHIVRKSVSDPTGILALQEECREMIYERPLKDPTMFSGRLLEPLLQTWASGGDEHLERVAPSSIFATKCLEYTAFARKEGSEK